MPTRLPLLSDAQADALASPPGLVDQIRARRGGQLIALDRLLLHSPPLAEGWNQFMGRVRTALALSPLVRELAMCAVAALNGADYEMHHHAPLYREAGATEAQVAALQQLAADPAGAARDPVFDPLQQAVLALVVEMTRQVAVQPETFARARDALGSDRAMLELVGVTAAYNMVSRVLVACSLTPDADA